MLLKGNKLIEVSEERENPIDNLIDVALSGNEGAYRQLHLGLARKLVMVPIIRLDSSFLGAGTVFFDPYADGICSIYIKEIDQKGVLPFFTSRHIFAEWAAQSGNPIEGIPLFAADVVRIVPDAAAIILNYGTNRAIELDKEILISLSKGLWLGSEAGLYRELSLVSSSEEEDLVSKVVMSQSGSSERNPQAPAKLEGLPRVRKHTENDLLIPGSVNQAAGPAISVPSGQKIKARIGIDEINFKKSEPVEEKLPESSTTPSGRYQRQRQGTFTKVLDVLRQFREKSSDN